MKASAWLGVVTLALGLGLLGCGGSIAAICEEECDCEGCSDDELDECIDTAEDLEHFAENEGCEDQFDDVVSCVSDEGECRGDRYDTDGCEPELEDLQDCMNDGRVADGGSTDG